MYVADFRLKGDSLAIWQDEFETFEQAQDALEQYACDYGSPSADVAAGYIAFEQHPFAYTVDGFEVSIFPLGELTI